MTFRRAEWRKVNLCSFYIFFGCANRPVCKEVLHFRPYVATIFPRPPSSSIKITFSCIQSNVFSKSKYVSITFARVLRGFWPLPPYLLLEVTKISGVWGPTHRVGLTPLFIDESACYLLLTWTTFAIRVVESQSEYAIFGYVKSVFRARYGEKSPYLLTYLLKIDFSEKRRPKLMQLKRVSSAFRRLAWRKTLYLLS